MLIDIPDEFFVRDCKLCGTAHARIRPCPAEAQEDVVLLNDEVIFSSRPLTVVEWLVLEKRDQNRLFLDFRIRRGLDQKIYGPAEYLTRMARNNWEPV